MTVPGKEMLLVDISIKMSYFCQLYSFLLAEKMYKCYDEINVKNVNF